MSSEIINTAQVTAQRLYALVRLVQHLKSAPRDELHGLLQPEPLSSNQDSSKVTLREAIGLNLVRANTDDDNITLHESVTPDDLNTWPNFRRLIQNRLYPVTDPDANNYLLYMVAAWLAVQSLDILNEKAVDLANRLNGEMFPESGGIETGRRFNDTKFSSWRRWAVVMGWGTEANSKWSAFSFMPNATDRLESVLSDVLPTTEMVSMRTFIERLGKTCPELDGGRLFDECWAVSRRGEERGNQLSWMLSVALRTLEAANLLEFDRQSDSDDVWSLYHYDGALWSEITHIQRTGAS